MIVLYVILFIWAIWFLIYSVMEDSISSFISFLLIGGTLIAGSPKWVDKVYSDHSEHYTFISAKTTNSVDGEISGNFLMFSGYLNDSIVYQLRTEQEDGYYKDIKVNADNTYLKESSSKKDTGLYIIKYKCITEYNAEILFVKNKVKQTISEAMNKRDCHISRKEIIVPENTIIKQIKL